jgi:prepilin-type processing-associated H-X9-DG protein
MRKHLPAALLFLVIWAIGAPASWLGAIQAQPAAPASPAAAGGPGANLITWTASPGATSYNIYRSSASTGPFAVIGAATKVSYTDTGLAAGATWYYSVTAVNPTGGGESAQSTVVTGTTWTGGLPTPITLSSNSYTSSVTTLTPGSPSTIYNGNAASTSQTVPITGSWNGQPQVWYSMPVTAGTTYLFTQSLNSTATIGVLQIQDAYGNQLAISQAYDTNNYGATQVIAFTATSTGTYTIICSNNQNSGSTSATYTLTVTQATSALPNITNATLNSLSYRGNGTPNFVIDPPWTGYPQIWNVSILTAGTTYTFTASGTGSGNYIYAEIQSMATQQGTYQRQTLPTSATVTFTAPVSGPYIIMLATGSQQTTTSASLTSSIVTGGATPGPGCLTLSWPTSSGANSYNVYRSTSSTGPFTTLIGTTTSLTYTDTGLAGSTTYYYSVVPLVSGTAGSAMPTISGTTWTGGVPTTISTLPYTGSLTNLTWNSGVYTGSVGGRNTYAQAWFYLPVTAGGVYQITETLNNTSLNGVLTVYDNYMNQVAQCSNTNTNGAVQIVVFQASTTANFIVVCSDNQTSGSTAVSFTLAVQQATYALPSFSGQTLSPTTCYVGNNYLVDGGWNGYPQIWNVCNLTAGVSYTFTATATSAASGNYLYMCAQYNNQNSGNHSKSSASSSGTTTMTSSFTWSPSTTGWYILMVGGYDNGLTLTNVKMTVTSSASSALSATGGPGQNTVSWPPVLGASGYNVYRSATNSPPFAAKLNSTPLNAASISYFDTGLSASTTYYYTVTSITNGVESAQSSAVSSTTWSGGVPTTINPLPYTSASTNLTLGSGVYTGNAAGQNTYPQVWYYLPATAGSTYQVTETLSNTSTNGVLTVFDNLGNQVAVSNNTSGTGACQNIVFTALNAGNYVITCSNNQTSGTTSVSFTLTAQQATTTLPSFSGQTLSTSTCYSGNGVPTFNIDPSWSGYPQIWNLALLTAGTTYTFTATATCSTSSQYLYMEVQYEATSTGNYTKVTLPTSGTGSSVLTYTAPSTGWYIVFIAGGSGQTLTNVSLKITSSTQSTQAGGPGCVALSWPAISGAGSYYIFRSTSSTGPFVTPLNSTTNTYYTDSGLPQNTTYYYTVAPVYNGVEGAQSAVMTSTTWSGGVPTTIPSVPYTSSSTNLTLGSGVYTGNAAGQSGQPQVWYYLPVTAGSTYQLTQTMNSTATNAVLTVNDNVGNQLAISNNTSGTGACQNIVFTASTTGNYIVICSNNQTAGTTSASFTLNVQQATYSLPSFSNQTLSTSTCYSGNGVPTFNIDPSWTGYPQIWNIALLQAGTAYTFTASTTSAAGQYLYMEVQYETTSTGNYTKVTLPGSGTGSSVLNYTAPTTGWYIIFVAGGSGQTINNVSLNITASTSFPQSAVGGPGVNVITWPPVAGASGYNVYRSSTNNPPFAARISTTPLSAASVSYTDAGLPANTSYYYTVTSIVNGVESSQSAVMTSATWVGGVPTTISSLPYTSPSTTLTPGQPTTIYNGAAASQSLTLPVTGSWNGQPQAWYYLPVTAGSTYQLVETLNSTATVGVLSVQDNNGNQLAISQNSAGSGAVQVLVFTAATTGTYIVICSNNQNSGSTSASFVLNVTQATAALPNFSGQTISISNSYSGPGVPSFNIDGPPWTNYPQIWNIANLTAGNTYTFTATATGANNYFYMELQYANTSTGTYQKVQLPSTGTGSATITYLAPTTGWYIVMVAGYPNQTLTNVSLTSLADSTNSPISTATQISPVTGPATGGTNVTINGSGFGIGSPTVSFWGRPATGVNVVSDGLLTAYSPDGPPGYANVLLSNGVATNFTYVAAAAPTFTLSATSAPINNAIPNVTITAVTGSFNVTQANNTVTVGGVNAPVTGITLSGAGTSQVTATALTVTIPAGTVCGPVNVVVSSNLGSFATATLTNGFTYLPTIIAPSSPYVGSLVSPTEITLAGNFGTNATATNTMVTFASANGTCTVNAVSTGNNGSLISVSPTSIVVIPPVGTAGTLGLTAPGSAIISVTVGGANSTTSNPTFSYMLYFNYSWTTWNSLNWQTPTGSTITWNSQSIPVAFNISNGFYSWYAPANAQTVAANGAISGTAWGIASAPYPWSTSSLNTNIAGSPGMDGPFANNDPSGNTGSIISGDWKDFATGQLSYYGPYSNAAAWNNPVFWSYYNTLVTNNQLQAQYSVTATTTTVTNNAGYQYFLTADGLASSPLGRTSYVGNSGMYYFNSDPSNPSNAKYMNGPFFQDSRTKLTDITDGTSNTLLFGESLAGPDNALPTFQLTWMGSGTMPTYWDCQTPSQYFMFSSTHPGIVNFAFCDGSVRSVSKVTASVPPDSMGSSGTQSDGDGTNTVQTAAKAPAASNPPTARWTAFQLLAGINDNAAADLTILGLTP